MTHTVEILMALADEYVGRSKLTEESETRAREALRAALTEALAPTFQPDWADFENGRECGRLEAAQPNIQNYPEKDISQPTIQQSLKVHASAEDYLRHKYGAYRGFPAWREIEEGYTQGRYDEAMAQGPDASIFDKYAPVQHDVTETNFGNTQAAQPVREPQFMEEVAYEHVFSDGSKSLSYALSFAGFPPRTDATHVNLLYYSVDGIGGGE